MPVWKAVRLVVEQSAIQKRRKGMERGIKPCRVVTYVLPFGFLCISLICYKCFVFYGEPCRNRTYTLLIKRQLTPPYITTTYSKINYFVEGNSVLLGALRQL